MRSHFPQNIPFPPIYPIFPGINDRIVSEKSHFSGMAIAWFPEISHCPRNIANFPFRNFSRMGDRWGVAVGLGEAFGYQHFGALPTLSPKC
jgi:hypothetical protein